MIPETYLIVDTDNTIREAQVGQTRESVIEDILGFQIEAKQVFRLSGAAMEEVTVEIAREIMERVEKAGPSFIVPSLIGELFPDRSEALSRAAWSAEERQADAIDRRADARRERLLEEAA